MNLELAAQTSVTRLYSVNVKNKQSICLYSLMRWYSTVQGFFHQPAHPRGEGATIKRISPPRKPPAGGDCGGSAAFPRWVLHIKIDRQSLPVFKFSWSPPRVRGGIK